MHAPLLPSDQSSVLHRTWRNGLNGTHYFDCEYARRLIEDYNRSGNAESLNELLRHVEPLAKSLFEYRGDDPARTNG